MNSQLRIGMDIGGTFTDYVLARPEGELLLHKRLTTPRNPAEGALAGLKELLSANDLQLSDVDLIVHGTTLVTNAIIERRGARTALLSTKGFRDVLEMGYEQRYDIYDLFLRFPEPIVPREFRLEVDERITRDGTPVRQPDPEQVRGQVREAVARGVAAIAISFLHSYRNPEHERKVARVVRKEFPDLAVSVSHEIVAEIGEYERTNTTACNAFVQPLMERYLDELTRELCREGFSGRFLLMQSSGGSATVQTARELPIRFLESGPAGGALVTGFLGKLSGQSDLLSFDMGGTTAKACLIRNGKPDIVPGMEAGRVHRFKPGSGLPIRAPVVDMIEIGAGGGSIAHVDSLGLLKVGPQSAGADPGPASYGLGGEEGTVTDACLLLGYFDPDYFLGGSMPLNLDAAKQAYRRLAAELNLDETQTAWGVYRIVCENMAGAARVHMIEKGQDPRRFSLVAFGGAGPAHAARVARLLGSDEVIVPSVSGVASALGFLVAPISFDFSRSHPALVRDLDWQEVQELYDDLERQAGEVLLKAGVAESDITYKRSADMRFSGQFHDLEVPFPSAPLDPQTGNLLTDKFGEMYAELYHSVLPQFEAMVLNWRLKASGPEPKLEMGRTVGATTSVNGARKGNRLAFFPETGQVELPVFDRYSLPFGGSITGPAIIEERESTTVLGPGDSLRVDPAGNLRIRVNNS